MKKFLTEFKTFIMRGNVLDLAVGVLIGGAFGAVVTSLSTNILSPILGLFAGQNFDGLQIEFMGVTLQYGAFLTSVVDFVIMAFVIFLLVKTVNKILSIGKKKDEPTEPAPPPTLCPFCCTEISDKATRCPHCTSVIAEKLENNA